MKFHLTAAVLVAVAFASKETTAEVRYHVTWFGDYGGVSAVAINDSGQVGGTRILAGRHHGFLWQNGVSIDLGGFEYTGSLVRDINNLGQVAGINPGNSARPLVWQADQGWTPLPGSVPEPSSLFSPHYYHSFAINDRNQVVVLADFPLETFIHSYLYDAGTWNSLGERPYATGPVFKTWANGLNEIGEVVGYSVFPGRLGLKKNQAMIWNGGQAKQLPALPGFEGSIANAICLGSP
jgi:probable HAF family extracellular repeat protein